MVINEASGDAESARMLRRLARVPRASGGDGEREARAFCADYLGELGYTVSEEPFEFSSFSGRFGTPLAGVALLLAFPAMAQLVSTGSPQWALAVGALLAAILLLLAWLGSGQRILDAPLFRRQGVNLVGTLGTDMPSVWLVAHLDSKSQPISILVRAAGIGTALVCLAGLLLCLALQLAGLAVLPLALVFAAVGALSAVTLILSVVGDASCGALDNATGVVSVLLAVALLSRRGAAGDVGVLLTSAEELGLAGAHAFARGRRAGTAINCDTVDDFGDLYCFTHGASAVQPAGALIRAADDCETDLKLRRSLIGILVDSVALQARGWKSATLSRGSMRTLGRIHTSGDSADQVLGSGVELAARVLERAVMILQSRS